MIAGDALLRRAYQTADPTLAQRLLLDLAKRLEHENPSAAESVREGLDETLTVVTLRLSPRLRRSLATTNAAESLISRTRLVKRNVKRWRGGQMMLRWVAAGVLEAVKGLRRLKGYAEMPARRAHWSEGYIYLAPFVEDEQTVFLKTIIPSRKATKQCLGEEKSPTKSLMRMKRICSSRSSEASGSSPRVASSSVPAPPYAKATFRKGRRLNIRLSSKDQEAIQKRALAEGLPYQTLISSLLRVRAAQGGVTLVAQCQASKLLKPILDDDHLRDRLRRPLARLNKEEPLTVRSHVIGAGRAVHFVPTCEQLFCRAECEIRLRRNGDRHDLRLYRP
jgi:hypothetical protein